MSSQRIVEVERGIRRISQLQAARDKSFATLGSTLEEFGFINHVCTLVALMIDMLRNDGQESFVPLLKTIAASMEQTEAYLTDIRGVRSKLAKIINQKRTYLERKIAQRLLCFER